MGVKRKRLGIGPNKDPPNLKRFRADILKFSSESTEKINIHGNADSMFKKKQTRKEKRKETRQLKKARRSAYRCGQPMPSSESMKKVKDTETNVQAKKDRREKVKEKRKRQKEKQKEKKKEKKNREEEEKKKAMLAEIQREEKMLKQLEKQLHMNKRKSKNLPQAFINDGLDYILDALDEDKVKDMYDEGDEGSDVDFGLEEDDDELTLATKSDEDEDDLSDDHDDSMYDEEHTLSDEDDIGDESDNDIASDDLLKEINERGNSGSKVANVRLDKDISNIKSILKSKTKGKVNKKTKIEKSKHVKFEETKSDSESTVTDISDQSDDDANDDANDDDDDDANDDDDDDGDDGRESKEKSVSSSSSETETPSLKEDIYGRLRDKRGNIVKDSDKTQKYIPPGKRLEMASMDEKKKIQMERLKKQLNGLVNRASESNMQPICSQIENLYLHNSRADVTETLSSLIIGACVTPVLTPERLAMELMMMIAILHGNIGTEIGAAVAQMLAQKFKSLFDDTTGEYGQGKEMDNVILLLSHLYNFKVIHSVMIFDIIQKFIDSFQQKDIELLLLILKNVGFSLRKDDPNALKETIIQIQSKANTLDPSQFTDQSRVKFMLDILMAIKNNNMRKIPNYNPELFDQLKKVTRNVLKGSNLGDGQLRINLKDLIDAEKLGRWWIVGSAWEGKHRDEKSHSDTSFKTSAVGDVSGKILELARKQRMNTDIRRNIFCVMMTSEDFVDAFEKLLRLGLKNQQEREIIHVIIDCCLQQKEFNPFYAYLMQKFCEYNRRFQMTFQFSLWDKFQEMSNLSEQNRHNLAKMVTHLIASKALSLSVFKVVEFGTLDKTMVRFIKQILQEILLDYPEDTIEAVFMRIAPLSKLHLLHEGLKLFMQHFLVRKKGKDVRDSPILKDRVEMAEKILSSEQSQMLL